MRPPPSPLLPRRLPRHAASPEAAGRPFRPTVLPCRLVGLIELRRCLMEGGAAVSPRFGKFHTPGPYPRPHLGHGRWKQPLCNPLKR